MEQLYPVQTPLPGGKTPTALATATLKPMIFTEGKASSFIDARGSLPKQPGTYLVYGELFSEPGGKVKYISMDGSVTGDLLSYSQSDDWLVQPFMSSGQPAPRFIFTDYHEGASSLRNGELSVWMIDSSEGSLYDWHLSTEPGSHADCNQPSFSPSGRWMTLICWAPPYQYYVDLVDLTSGEQKVIPIPSAAVTVPVENWSQDETHFYTWSHTYIYCFVSLLDDEAVCPDVGKPLLSVSPDWQRVVLFSGDTLHDPADVRISIVDMECVLAGSPCENSLDFELPSQQSVDGNSYSYPAIRWNASGSKLAWLMYTHGDPASQGSVASTACGWITLSEKTDRPLCGPAMRQDSLLDVFPDENWLLLSDEWSLYLLSTREPALQTLVSPTYEFGAIWFYGWFVVQ